MAFVSITRLRIRSVRFLPFFAIHALRSLSQAKASRGFLCGSLLPDRKFTFWTMTVWESQQDMRNYILSGPHKKAMPKLLHWCDEASIAHWEQQESTAPTWAEADRRMRTEGRISKVNHPSPSHAGLNYETPDLTRAAPVFTGSRMPKK
jgi:heme-degrading monooxygenase HmoA